MTKYIVSLDIEEEGDVWKKAVELETFNFTMLDFSSSSVESTGKRPLCRSMSVIETEKIKLRAMLVQL